MSRIVSNVSQCRRAERASPKCFQYHIRALHYPPINTGSITKTTSQTTFRHIKVTANERLRACVNVGTRWGGHSKGPQCFVAWRSAEFTVGRISEIKECDKDRWKKRKMTEGAYKSGNYNTKRKVSASSPFLSTMEGSLAVKNVSHTLKAAEEGGGVCD